MPPSRTGGPSALPISSWIRIWERCCLKPVCPHVNQQSMERFLKTNLPITQVEKPFPKGKLIVSKTDLKGITTYANDAFVELSGFSREELIGKNHNIVRHP